MKPKFQVQVKLEEWFIQLQPSLRKFPKAMRFTLVQRIENSVLECLDQVMLANLDKPNRSAFVLKARLANERTQMLIRLAQAQGLIDSRHYELFSEKMSEIGRMLSGWARASKE